MPLALLALALGGFTIGTGEFVTAGLLPQIAGSLHVSIPTAGYLISAYAIGVVLGAPLLTALCAHRPARRVLVGLLGVMAIGNLASALAPTFGLLVGARVLAALAHGAFFGVGSVVASRLAKPGQAGRAVATMFLGLTFSNVAGVPLGTLLGQHVGWRWTFAAIGGLTVASCAGTVALLPADLPATGTGIAAELRTFRSGTVWYGLAITAVAQSALFASISYVAPMATRVSHVSASTVPLVLVLFGLGSCVGIYAGGRVGELRLQAGLVGGLGSVTGVLVLLAVAVQQPAVLVVGFLLLGVTAFFFAPLLQVQVLQAASDAPTLASAANQGAFNVGNALGAFIGGLVIDAGLGYAAPNAAGAVFSAAALILVLTVGRAFRPRPPAVTGPGQERAAPSTARSSASSGVGWPASISAAKPASGDITASRPTRTTPTTSARPTARSQSSW